MRANKDRQLAIQEGRKFYVSGTSCKTCGCVIKYVSSYGCHYCNWKKGLEKLNEGVCDKYHTHEISMKRLRRWRVNNPDKSAEQWRRTDKAYNAEKSMRYRATKMNQTPELTQQEKYDIMKVYKLAKKLTEETGVKHEVDHIMPLSKGGIHHPYNLQVLTKYENQSKGNRT